eukprot:m.252119 g.252119  ORF g.252119 m.252119 type:complete len:579 (-) comp17615_c0_seq1:145-1881(-)
MAARLLRSESLGEPLSPETSPAVHIPPVAQRELPFASVVKIFVISSRPNYMLPWQIGEQQSCTGSGFVLDGRYILTNAHVVNDATTVRVRRHGGSDKFPAEIACINRVCDLALLTCKAPEFWEGLSPLSISPIVPELYENVMVIGYPMGGDSACVTRGVVSRITTMSYSQPKFGLADPPLMAIQIDAAINSGNSGGPVFRENGQVVGVAFSGYAGVADNIGYIIPKQIIDNFVTSVRTAGLCNVVCDLGLAFMLCENTSLRAKHHMVPPLSGVLVTKVAPLGAGHEAGIRVDDILLSVNGNKISNDGTCTFRRDERLSFLRHVSEFSGTQFEIEVLRDGARLHMHVPARTTPPLVPHRFIGKMPSYFIVGGLVFTTLTYGLMEATVESLSEDAWQAGLQPKDHADKELVILLCVLSHEINHGYYSNKLPLLDTFNGAPVRNLRLLKEAVDKVTTGYLHFRLKDGLSIILDALAWREAQVEILQTYAVPSACSTDLSEPLALDGPSVTGTPAAATPASKPPTRPTTPRTPRGVAVPAAAKRPTSAPAEAAAPPETPSTKRAKMRPYRGFTPRKAKGGRS